MFDYLHLQTCKQCLGQVAYFITVHCVATGAPLRVVRPHLELVLVLLRVHAVVHDGQQPGGALQGVGAARLWRLGWYH